MQQERGRRGGKTIKSSYFEDSCCQVSRPCLTNQAVAESVYPYLAPWTKFDYKAKLTGKMTA